MVHLLRRVSVAVDHPVSRDDHKRVRSGNRTQCTKGERERERNVVTAHTAHTVVEV